MSGILTWRDLLLPDNQDTRVILSQVDDTEGGHTAKTSTLSLQLWHPERLPHAAHLIADLSSRVQQHLRVIVDESYLGHAARMSFINIKGKTVTPGDALLLLRSRCEELDFRINYGSGAAPITHELFHMVATIMSALALPRPTLRHQERSSDNAVITDNTFRLRNGIKILWENKSPKVFDEFIERLMGQMRTYEPLATLCTEPTQTMYDGYKAILGKLAYHAGDVQPRIRWAVVFSGLRYIILYIPRTPRRPEIYCSPIMRFCLRDDDEQEPPIRPPIWSMVVYMLLTEVLNIDDGALRQRFGLPVHSEEPSSSDLGSRVDARERRRSARFGPTTNEVDEMSGSSQSSELTVIPNSMMVQCLDAFPMKLTFIDTHHSRHVEKQNCPFIHLDRQLGAGWSSVYASSKSHIVVKFASVPKRDKAELERQLSNEKAAYHKLSRVSEWLVPRLYGEYEWYGGRAIVLSDEGRSLSHLESFPSLSLVERLILFGELYCIHFFGVEHRDFAPRNVLRKKWSYSLKIIDFGFSNVNHSCPGWRECGELKDVWSKLELDRVNFSLKSWVVEKFKIPALASKSQPLLLSMIIVLTLFAFAVLIVFIIIPGN